MIARLLVTILALAGCAPTSSALSTGAPRSPVPPSALEAPPTTILVKHERHVARLGPPFAAANGARRVGDERLAEVRVTER